MQIFVPNQSVPANPTNWLKMFETHSETIPVRRNRSQGRICNLLNCAIQQRTHGFVKVCSPFFFARSDQHEHGANWDSDLHVSNLAQSWNMELGGEWSGWGPSSSQNPWTTWHQPENSSRKAPRSKKWAPQNLVSDFKWSDRANLCPLNALLKACFATFDPHNIVCT